MYELECNVQERFIYRALVIVDYVLYIASVWDMAGQYSSYVPLLGEHNGIWQDGNGDVRCSVHLRRSDTNGWQIDKRATSSASNCRNGWVLQWTSHGRSHCQTCQISQCLICYLSRILVFSLSDIGAYFMRMLSPVLGMLSSAVIVMVCQYTVFMQYAVSLLGQCFIVI